MDSLGKILAAMDPMAAAAATAAGGYVAYRVLSRIHYNYGRIDARNKAIFISGCDSGFGYSLALYCRETLGMTVIAGCYGITEKGGETSKDEGSKNLREKGVHVVPLDVTDDKSVEEAVGMTRKIIEENGTELWCLVNNAASLVFADASWQPRWLIRKQLEVNVEGPLVMTTAFLPTLREAARANKFGRPRVVNMLSFCTDCPLPTLSVYTATKAALRSMSAGMRMELGLTSGLDVVMVNPGDHPGATPLCSGPAMVKMYEQMEEHLDKNCRDFGEFRDYFQGCRSKFTNLFPLQPLRPLPDPGFYSTFSDLLTARSPRPEYVNSPLGTRAFFGLIGWMPVKWADQVRLAMMKLPKV